MSHLAHSPVSVRPFSLRREGVLLLAEGIDCDGSQLLSGLCDVIGDDVPVFGGVRPQAQPRQKRFDVNWLNESKEETNNCLLIH